MGCFFFAKESWVHKEEHPGCVCANHLLITKQTTTRFLLHCSANQEPHFLFTTVSSAVNPAVTYFNYSSSEQDDFSQIYRNIHESKMDDWAGNLYFLTVKQCVYLDCLKMELEDGKQELEACYMLTRRQETVHQTVCLHASQFTRKYDSRFEDFMEAPPNPFAVVPATANIASCNN